MKPFAIPAAFAAATLFGAAAAQAQGFASYDAYAPTHPEAGYASSWFTRDQPTYAYIRYDAVAPGYDPEQPGRSGWRRGEYLPPDYRLEVVGDYAYRHLRRPPRGYAWYRDADDYILAAAASGRIATVINSAD